MTWRVAASVLAGVALIALAAVLTAPSWASNLCVDRRDYAPGYNTYRIVYCDSLPSYKGDLR